MTDKIINHDNLQQLTEEQKKEKMLMYSPAQLAYAGDAVYELLVRAYIVRKHEFNVNLMHKEAVKFVKASSQSDFVKRLDPILTDEERRIVKRGRNAKVNTCAKNQDIIDYRYATGFEALIGYLYLNNEHERILFLFDEILKMIQ